MDRAKWIKVSDELLKHLKAIRRILKLRMSRGLGDVYKRQAEWY